MNLPKSFSKQTIENVFLAHKKGQNPKANKQIHSQAFISQFIKRNRDDTDALGTFKGKCPPAALLLR